MSEEFPVTPQNRLRQLADKGHYDRETVFAILDAGLVAQVAFTTADGPVVVPMIYARDGDTIYLHGARKARVIRMLEQTDTACVNVTLVDGIVLARSAFNSSMNYRSVTLFGRPELVDDRDGKLHAMRLISEHLMPGRWDELRAPHEREIKMTGVIRLPIASASAKVSAGPPDDEDDDYAIPVWAGVIPIACSAGELETDDRILDGVEASDAVRAMQDRTY
jgi:nitroimidazol reductase NimA-like FMN-containing flavoprotein (pyridoxamine 5'-phosphate oxidase superfamily)